MIQIVNKINIGTKIGLGFIFVFLIFGVIGYLVIDSLKDVERKYNEINNHRYNSTTVLEIQKDISELQRITLVYSQSGKDSDIKRIKTINSDINESLLVLKTKMKDDQELKVIEQMISVIKDNAENIESMKQKFGVMSHLIERKLPAIINKGSFFLKKRIQYYEKNKNSLKTVMYRELLELWLDSHIKSVFFIQKRKYPLKKKVYTNIQLMTKISTLISADHIKDSQIVSFDEYIEKFKSIFEEAIQANRIYLSLVNVVMAGEAIEFASLAKILGASSLEKLEIASIENSEIISKNNFIISIGIALSLPFIISIAFFYHLNISLALEKITNVFGEFYEGNFQRIVPGSDRKDEIGLLAKAANSFRDLNQSLLKSKEEAEKSYKIKSEFLANMSHEIRTPMNGVLGMVSLLNETNLTVEQKNMLETIVSSGEGLLSILDSILDLSKADAGKIKLEYSPFDLRKLVEEVGYLFQQQIEKKSLDFEIIFRGDLIPKFLSGDITRLKQVLINLLSNAVKFTEKGKISIIIENKNSNNQFSKIKFTVTDTGMGIAKESQGELFRAFTQADTSITRKFGGTGLGLAISTKLTSLMGSKIDLKSEIGVGSEFSFEIEYGTICEFEVSSIDNSLHTFEHVHVLLAEDNDINTLVAKRMLEKLKCKVTATKNGLEALEACKKSQFDFILMDMQMPVLDGVNATLQIRNLDGFKNIPIIALTANALLTDQEKCLEAGMNDFMTKPINFERLRNLFIKFT